MTLRGLILRLFASIPLVYPAVYLGPPARLQPPKIEFQRVLDSGTWTTLADGRAVWRLKIRSPDATGIRVEFSDFSVGDGKVWVRSDESTDGPYIGKGPYGSGEFWSGTVGGESVMVEYEVPPGGRAGGAPPFQIHGVAHQKARPEIHAVRPAIADLTVTFPLSRFPKYLQQVAG